MRNFFVIYVLFVFFSSCEKNYIVLSKHEEQKIIGEGFFTDSLKKHQFLFTKSNNLGTSNIQYINDINLLVNTPSGPVNYTNIGDGLYESNEEFKGVYGEEYTIEFTHEDILHTKKTKMPAYTHINGAYFEAFDSTSLITQLVEIDLNITSAEKQYLKYDLYKAIDYLLPEDTVWVETRSPIYHIVKIDAGDSLLVHLPINSPGINSDYIRNKDLFKINTYIISNEVAEYLLELAKYNTNDSKKSNGEFYNPPYYYSNEAYGFGYGTIVDSFIHVY